MGGSALGLLVLLFLVGTGVLGSWLLGLHGGLLALGVYVIAYTQLVALALFLSSFDAMTRGTLVAGVALVFIATIGAWILGGSPRWAFPRPRLKDSPRPLVVVAIAVALALAYVFALIVGTAPNGWDPLNYHLPRAAFWSQSGHIGYIADAYDQRLNFNPPHGEIGLAVVLSVTRQERLAAFVQFFAALACAAGVFALARRIGRPRREATFGALLFLALPIVLLQASGVKNDLVVASFLLAASVFVLGQSRRELLLATFATALAVGTKFTAAYGVVVLLLLAVVGRPADIRLLRLAAVAVGALAGSYWYAVNLHNTGELLGDQSNVPGLTAPFQPPENVVTAFGDVVDMFDLSGAGGWNILLFVIAAVGLSAALLLRRTGVRRALLAGVIVASPLALLFLTDHVGRPLLLDLYDALGKPQAYLAVGDEVSSSPTTASDTASWFGPVGLLLVTTTAVVALRSRPRRVTATVVGLVPLLWLAMVAVTLTYHPWEGRFYVFAVACSAALWGTALRSPAAAWGVVAVAAITAGLSVVHYVEKPASSVWKQARWEVQSQHDPPLGPALRFVDASVPSHTTIGLALGANEFGYPVFGPHLSRHVLLVPFGSNGRDLHAKWLFADAGRSKEIDTACWRPALQSEAGVVFSSSGTCG